MLLSFWCHLQLNEDIAVTSIVNSGLHSLIESYSDSAEINIGWRNLNASITSSSKDLEVVFLEECVGGCNSSIVLRDQS